MALKDTLTELFTWWNGQTLGTRLFTGRHGRRVGEDDQGNVYYEQASGVGPLGRPRRWVIYNGLAEASRVPPEWHMWLHYTSDAPPTDDPRPRRDWEKEHIPNLTGTAAAYRPAGSLLREGVRPAATGDYEAWRPE